MEQTGLGPECLQLGKSASLCAPTKVRAGGAGRRRLSSCTWHGRWAPESPGPGAEARTVEAGFRRLRPLLGRPCPLWRRGLALQSSAVHLPSCDPCRSPGPRTIPCPPVSPHYLGGDQGQRHSRQRALRGRRHARAPGPASQRGEAKTRGPLPGRASRHKSAARPQEGLSAWTSALARGNRPGRDSPHPSGVPAAAPPHRASSF